MLVKELIVPQNLSQNLSQNLVLQDQLLLMKITEYLQVMEQSLEQRPQE